MRLNFRQGLVSSEIDSTGLPNYLTVNTTGVTLSTANRPIVFSIASGTKNYSVGFYQDVLAWTSTTLSGVSECWLYIDINAASSARRYGITLLAPTYGPTAPTSPSDTQHWFDTSKNVMKVYSASSSTWLTTIRVIAGHFTTLSLSTVPFGSQVGITSSSSVYTSGSIMVDGFGVAIKDSSGNFVTTEDVLMVDGASTYAAKLESNVAVVAAAQPIAAFHVVSYTNDGDAVPADYDDVGSKIVGIATEDANTDSPLNVVLSGKVHNPLWNWGSANVTLWVDQNGELVAVDPYTVGGRAKTRVPVARTIDAQTIIFDQGMGGVGEKGDAGDIAGVAKAAAAVIGITKLSVDPDDFANPIAVGINDPVITTPKAPLVHTHPATQITVSPFGTFTGANAQLALEFLQSQKLTNTGGTLTGNVSSTVQATADAHLITLGQTNTLIAASANTYKRLTLDGTVTSIVTAFNAQTSANRTLAANIILVVEWASKVYLWTGGAGSPVSATSDSQFMLIGVLAATGGSEITFNTNTAFTAYGDDDLYAIGWLSNGTTYLIDLTSGEISMFPLTIGGTNHASSASFCSANGLLAIFDAPNVVSGDISGSIKFYSKDDGWAATGQEITYYNTNQPILYVTQYSFSGDGTKIAIGHANGAGDAPETHIVSVYDLTTMAELMTYTPSFSNPNTQNSYTAAFQLNQTGSLLAYTQGMSMTVGQYPFYLFNTATGAKVANYETAACTATAFTPDYSKIAILTTSSSGAGLVIIDAASPPATIPAATFTLPGGSSDIVYSAPVGFTTVGGQVYLMANRLTWSDFSGAFARINYSTGSVLTLTAPSTDQFAGGYAKSDGSAFAIGINVTTTDQNIYNVDIATMTVTKSITVANSNSGTYLYNAGLL